MGDKVRCPHCGSEGAWYSNDGRDVFLRCLCGYCRIVESVLAGGEVVTHTDTGPNVTLPRRGSKLYDCLAALVGMSEGTTAEIAREVNKDKLRRDWQTNSDVASRLTVLGYKGLAEVLEDGKGAPGGSTWGLTDAARKFFPQAL